MLLQNGQDRRRRLLVLALVQRIYHDDRGNPGRFERCDDQCLQLGGERFVARIRTRLDDRNKSIFELWVAISQISGQGREDEVQAASILESSGTEETGPQETVCEAILCESLGNRGFPTPGLSVQPEHPSIMQILRPRDDFLQDFYSRTLQTALAVARPETRFLGMRKCLQQRYLSIGDI